MRLKRIGSIFIATIVLVGTGMLMGIWIYQTEFKEQKEEQPRKETLYKQDVDVAEYEEVLSRNTDYIILEYDMIKKRKTESRRPLPEMYYGMNRQQFVDAMKVYAMSVPLSEREHGFVGLEVQSFSASQVIVRMDYRYISPDTCFYLKVVDGEVVALLEDQNTIYMNTGILFDSLPEQIQMQIERNLCLKGEKELYSFLEAYTS